MWWVRDHYEVLEMNLGQLVCKHLYSVPFLQTQVYYFIIFLKQLEPVIGFNHELPTSLLLAIVVVRNQGSHTYLVEVLRWNICSSQSSLRSLLLVHCTQVYA